MLKGEKFDAFALMLSIKCIFAYYQIYFCFLSNVNMIAVKCNFIQVICLMNIC